MFFSLASYGCSERWWKKARRITYNRESSNTLTKSRTNNMCKHKKKQNLHIVYTEYVQVQKETKFTYRTNSCVLHIVQNLHIVINLYMGRTLVVFYKFRGRLYAVAHCFPSMYITCKKMYTNRELPFKIILYKICCQEFP
jgi:hypothetical protein